MLPKYKDDHSIAGITADYRLSSEQTSYYGKIPFPLIWGWATWKRSWKGYSFNLDQFSKNNLPQLIQRWKEIIAIIGKRI